MTKKKEWWKPKIITITRKELNIYIKAAARSDVACPSSNVR